VGGTGLSMTLGIGTFAENTAAGPMAISRVVGDTAGRDYPKTAAGKGRREVLHCLQRRPSGIVYRQLLRDAAPHEAGPRRHPRAARSSNAERACGKTRALIDVNSTMRQTTCM
jgi:hypothetical protein